MLFSPLLLPLCFGFSTASWVLKGLEHAALPNGYSTSVYETGKLLDIKKDDTSLLSIASLPSSEPEFTPTLTVTKHTEGVSFFFVPHEDPHLYVPPTAASAGWFEEKSGTYKMRSSTGCRSYTVHGVVLLEPSEVKNAPPATSCIESLRTIDTSVLDHCKRSNTYLEYFEAFKKNPSAVVLIFEYVAPEPIVPYTPVAVLTKHHFTWLETGYPLILFQKIITSTPDGQPDNYVRARVALPKSPAKFTFVLQELRQSTEPKPWQLQIGYAVVPHKQGVFRTLRVITFRVDPIDMEDFIPEREFIKESPIYLFEFRTMIPVLEHRAERYIAELDRLLPQHSPAQLADFSSFHSEMLPPSQDPARSGRVIVSITVYNPQNRGENKTNRLDQIFEQVPATKRYRYITIGYMMNADSPSGKILSGKCLVDFDVVNCLQIIMSGNKPLDLSGFQTEATYKPACRFQLLQESTVEITGSVTAEEVLPPGAKIQWDDHPVFSKVPQAIPEAAPIANQRKQAESSSKKRKLNH